MSMKLYGFRESVREASKKDRPRSMTHKNEYSQGVWPLSYSKMNVVVRGPGIEGCQFKSWLFTNLALYYPEQFQCLRQGIRLQITTYCSNESI